MITDGAAEADFNERLERFCVFPTVATYHQVEETLVDLLKEVDGLISATAGIEFAANARRSGFRG